MFLKPHVKLGFQGITSVGCFEIHKRWGVANSTYVTAPCPAAFRNTSARPFEGECRTKHFLCHELPMKPVSFWGDDALGSCETAIFRIFFGEIQCSQSAPSQQLPTKCVRLPCRTPEGHCLPWVLQAWWGCWVESTESQPNQVSCKVSLQPILEYFGFTNKLEDNASAKNESGIRPWRVSHAEICIFHPKMSIVFMANSRSPANRGYFVAVFSLPQAS